MIKILEKHVADKIAAGEVIDRPVSIVKELVENSLDAGGTSITVEIRGGGKEYIRVTDDGCGIEASDITLAFKRHATGKISREEDLDAIGTLGFRGEALASIAAVARVEMITRTEADKMGRRLTVEGSEILEDKPTGCPKGTTITVKDLFYNTPARLKFLGSDNSEARRITSMVSRIALAYPDVRFRLINGSRDVFTTSGKGNILENILRIYGTDLKKDLLPVDHAADGMVIRGFVSSSALSSSSRNRQFFCVNGRVVSSSTIERGLEKAYKQRLFTGRFPLAFLFISVPAETLDVNVHPTKKEIRFDEPFAIEDMIEEAVGAALMSGDSVGRVDVESRTKAIDGAIDQKPPAPAIENDISASQDKETEVDINKLLDSMRQEVREEQISLEPEISTTKEKLDIEGLDIKGIVLDTYIIATDDSAMYLIDQHAAHERVLFERFLKEYNKEDVARQTMLTPLQISVSAELESSEDMWLESVGRLGYSVEPFGNRVYLIREIPAFLNDGDAESFIKDFFIALEETPDLTEFAALEKIIMRSCKSAVKGGDRLHPREVDSLMSQLAACDNPYSCPHGRPIFVKMTKYDLERMFKRA